MADCDCKVEAKNQEERGILIVLLGINAFMFLAEATLGVLSESAALIADSLDMSADAAVYGIGLYAVGRPTLAKLKAAHVSGIFQVILGTSVFMDVLRRLIWGSAPWSFLMITVGIAALTANIICLLLISKYRDGEVHMRASWIFSKNDVIANLGIIMSGGLVYLFNSRYPDLITGMLIAIIVIRGGVQIVRDASNEKQLRLEKCL